VELKYIIINIWVIGVLEEGEQNKEKQESENVSENLEDAT
jgi:hypothetical protein